MASARSVEEVQAFLDELQDRYGAPPVSVRNLAQYARIRLMADRLGLDLSGLHVRTLDARWFVPAPAQGALAVQSRVNDAAANNAVEALHDDRAALCVGLERAVLFAYRGGCQVPLGVHAMKNESGFHLWASAARVWEEMPRRIYLKGTNANTLGAAAQVTLRRSEAFAFLRRLGGETAFDLVFLDPPYAGDTLARALAGLVAARALAPGGLVVAESDRRHPPGPIEGLAAIDERRYGDTLITWYVPAGHAVRGGAGVEASDA